MNVKDCIGLILILILICLLYSYLKSKLVEGLTVNEAINLQSECLYGEYPIGGNTSISDCPTDQNTSSEECCLCPVGKALRSGSSRLKSSANVTESDCVDIECPDGKELNGSSCDECVAGKYSDATTGECSTTAEPPHTTETECTNAGGIWTPGCVDCGTGTFQPTTGQTTCSAMLTTCAEGLGINGTGGTESSGTGNTQDHTCGECPAGKVNDGNSLTCTEVYVSESVTPEIQEGCAISGEEYLTGCIQVGGQAGRVFDTGSGHVEKQTGTHENDPELAPLIPSTELWINSSRCERGWSFGSPSGMAEDGPTIGADWRSCSEICQDDGSSLEQRDEWMHNGMIAIYGYPHYETSGNNTYSSGKKLHTCSCGITRREEVNGAMVECVYNPSSSPPAGFSNNPNCKDGPADCRARGKLGTGQPAQRDMFLNFWEGALFKCFNGGDPVANTNRAYTNSRKKCEKPQPGYVIVKTDGSDSDHNTLCNDRDLCTGVVLKQHPD